MMHVQHGVEVHTRCFEDGCNKPRQALSCPDIGVPRSGLTFDGPKYGQEVDFGLIWLSPLREG
jgi:hypothetical protein